MEYILRHAIIPDYMVHGNNNSVLHPKETYHFHQDDSHYAAAGAAVLYYNPRIVHPDHIRAAEIIRLMPLPEASFSAFSPVPEDFYHHKLAETRHRLEPLRSHPSADLRDNLPMNEEERDIFFALARAQEQYNYQRS